MAEPERTGVTVHVQLSDEDPIVVPSSEFEAGEHGVTTGLRLIPWHRVVRYWLDLPQAGEADQDRARPTVRLELDGGSGASQRLVVDADRFEVGPWTVSYLDPAPDRVEPDRGLAIFRMVHIPWARVREFERVRVNASEGGFFEPAVGRMPERPDAPS